MVVEQQYINAEKFLEMVEQPQYEDCVVELVEGEIIKMSKPSLGHGEIVSWLTLKVGGYIINNNLGRISSGDAGFILQRNPDGRDTVRGIDFAFISKAKSPGPLEFKLAEIAPDLAVEVISPSNEASDIHFKVLQLLNAGAAQVWIVYPDSRTIVVHGESGAYTLREDDTLSGGEILPGFEIRVGELFPS